MNIHRNFDLSKPRTNAKIISSGVHLPSEIVTSEHIFDEFNSEQNYGIPNNWMVETMGIVERRVSCENQTPSDLAVIAARKALESCDKLNPDEIGMVLFCGIERDQPEPATAHIVQQKLGLKADITFDVANACFGFIDGIRIAEKFIKSGTVKYALVTTGEIPTRLMKNYVAQLAKGGMQQPFKDIAGFLSVGDAGGAVIMGGCDEQQGFKMFKTVTQSNHSEKCYYKHDINGDVSGQMLMAQIVAKTLRLQFDHIPFTLNDLGWDEPDFFMTHQVGKKAFDAAANLGIAPRNKMIKSYEKLGNITSATFAVNHHQLTQREDHKPGDKVYCCYSGSGIVIGQFGYTM